MEPTDSIAWQRRHDAAGSALGMAIDLFFGWARGAGVPSCEYANREAFADAQK